MGGKSRSEDALPAYVEAPGTVRAGGHAHDVAGNIVAVRRARLRLNSVDLLRRLLLWALLLPQDPPARLRVFLLSLF